MAKLVCELIDTLTAQRGMLAQLAARLQARQAGGAQGDVGRDEDGLPIVVDENCSVCYKPILWSGDMAKPNLNRLCE